MDKIFDEAMKATREVQALWETRTAQMLDEFVKSQTFVNAMTTSLEQSLDARKSFDTAMTRWAELFGIVTKKDINLINQQLYDQNAKLEKIASLLADIRNQGLNVNHQPANNSSSNNSNHNKKKGS